MITISQTAAPSGNASQFGLRPWNTRAALHTMPQAKKPTALRASARVSPSSGPATVRTSDRDGAEDIGRAPPVKRRNFLLPPEEQQHAAEQHADKRRDEIESRRYRVT